MEAQASVNGESDAVDNPGEDGGVQDASGDEELDLQVEAWFSDRDKRYAVASANFLWLLFSVVPQPSPAYDVVRRSA